MHSVTVYPTSSLQGSLTFPGDKSISHRAIIFSALSEGTTRIRNLLEGEDVLSTIDCFRAMGVKIQKEGEEWVVQGVGLHGLRPPVKTLYCGNSGTTLRLMMGILAAQPFESALTGDASLNRRPVKRVAEPLTQMGARFSVEGEGTPERVIRVKGARLQGIRYRLPVASAQVKSALLLAGLWAEGTTTVEEPALSRDHTERILEGGGVDFERKGERVSVKKAKKIGFPPDFSVPADFSSAAFFLVAGLLVPSSKLELKDVGLNPTRTGALDVLKEMGGNIQIKGLKSEAGEETGTLEVVSSSLKGAVLQGDLIPRLIDEIPIMAVAAGQALGETLIKDAAELRVKESDRIGSLVDLLSRLGVQVEERPDGMVIQGRGRNPFLSASTESFGDHRMAMSMAVAGLVAQGPVQIKDVECVNTSFPSFWETLRKLGIRVVEE